MSITDFSAVVAQAKLKLSIGFQNLKRMLKLHIPLLQYSNFTFKHSFQHLNHAVEVLK